MVKIYKVGGCVRDEILGHQPHDIDYAVEAKSYADMIEYMNQHGFKIFLETEKYLTVRARFPDSKVVADFTLCRTDGTYSDNRRPDSVEIGSINDDLARRDFTINAIAIDNDTGEVLDPYNGREDLEKGIIRCVGSARDRLTEDPLRMLRALRFMITKGFDMHNDVFDVVYSEWIAPLLESVSVDRRRMELDNMFKHDTIKTMNTLSTLPSNTQKVIFNGLWLQPTSKKIKRS
jgi:tRNA nucleotidyltransferase (CCA-adding enzyme)